MNVLFFFCSILLGYVINRSLSKDGHRIKKRLPFIKIKFIQFCPNVKIHVGNKYIWVHHWITYSIVLIITLTLNVGVLDTLITKGVLVGGILQGLTFPDWKNVVINKKVN
jgi:hypothetical protein